MMRDFFFEESDVTFYREDPQNRWIQNSQLRPRANRWGVLIVWSGAVRNSEARFQSIFFATYRWKHSLPVNVNHFLPGRFPLKFDNESYESKKKRISRAKIRHKIIYVLRINIYLIKIKAGRRIKTLYILKLFVHWTWLSKIRKELCEEHFCQRLNFWERKLREQTYNEHFNGMKRDVKMTSCWSLMALLSTSISNMRFSRNAIM